MVADLEHRLDANGLAPQAAVRDLSERLGKRWTRGFCMFLAADSTDPMVRRLVAEVRSQVASGTVRALL